MFKQKLNNISNTFATINRYPHWLIKDLYSKIALINERGNEANVSNKFNIKDQVK